MALASGHVRCGNNRFRRFSIEIVGKRLKCVFWKLSKEKYCLKFKAESKFF